MTLSVLKDILRSKIYDISLNVYRNTSKACIFIPSAKNYHKTTQKPYSTYEALYFAHKNITTMLKINTKSLSLTCEGILICDRLQLKTCYIHFWSHLLYLKIFCLFYAFEHFCSSNHILCSC